MNNGWEFGNLLRSASLFYSREKKVFGLVRMENAIAPARESRIMGRCIL